MNDLFYIITEDSDKPRIYSYFAREGHGTTIDIENAYKYHCSQINDILDFELENGPLLRPKVQLHAIPVDIWGLVNVYLKMTNLSLREVIEILPENLQSQIISQPQRNHQSPSQPCLSREETPQGIDP